MVPTSRRETSISSYRNFAKGVGEGLMEKVSSMEELKERLKEGYKAELLFRLSTQSYIVTTWWVEKDGGYSNHKDFKFPKAVVKVNDLIKMVYDK